MKRLADILLSLAALLLLAACTDDADVYNTPASSEGNLCVYVPVTREGDATTSPLSNSNPTYNATENECQINNLHLYAFPVGGGTFLSQDLPSPEASNMINDGVASYQLQIKPGEYRVYVVANMNDVLKDTPIYTEDDLKEVVLRYNPSMSKPGMPVANNLPMIYDPTKAADGKTEKTIIQASATAPQTVAANLQFTCVKVCLNLVYDPTADGVSSALTSKGLQIADVKAERLSPSTNLVWDGKFSNSNVSDDYADGFESVLYKASPSTGEGPYYTKWTENSANADVNDKDIITPDGKGEAQPPKDPTKKWLFRATYYLPERYAAQAAQQSALKVGGAVGGSANANSYNINLGHRQDETSTTEVPTFPRGTYYEIVGRIKSLGNINLDCVVGVKDWEMATIDVDLNHTTLWVSKTSAEVTSLQNAIIDYGTNTDASNITFGCDTEIEKISAGKSPVIVATNDIATHRVTFSINPELSVKDFTDAKALKGTAKVWIKAGNIKKYLDVEYDVTPYFKVDPVDIVIFYDKDNTAELTKVVKFTTNLGGIQFPSGWTVSAEDGQKVQYAQSEIKIKCNNNNVADGTFTITATSNPETTTTHVFTVKSIDAVGKDATTGKDIYKEQQVRVTVRPPKGNYIIYMRAINDLAWCNGGGTEEYKHSLMLDEDSRIGNVNNNWRDGWWEAQEQDSNNNWQNVTWDNDLSPHPDYHFVYVYTQIGETNADGTKDENNTEWYFTKQYDKTADKRHTVSHDKDMKDYKGKWWPGDMMTADNNNPGWYYYSISVGAKSVGVNKDGKAQKTIKPGQTLLVFSNGTYLDAGFQSHRFTHHNDPGITLFNYEDREGWYLYDPLSDPYYRVYDEKPTVVDVEYTIYTKNKKITAWYCQYGVNPGGKDDKFTLWCNNYVSGEFECNEYGKKNGETWYKTILHLKAPLGEYDKILVLKVNGDEIHTTLFDGDNYPSSTKMHGNRYVVEGSYDPGTKKWSKGAPF